MSRIIVAVAAMMMILAPAFSWELSFGKESGKVGIIAPVGAEDFPVGPASYRAVGDNLWVLDSAAGKVLCFDSSSKLVKEIAIPSLPKAWVLDDFALQFADVNAAEPSAIIVVDLMERLVIKFALDGKEIFKIKPANLIQLDEIEIDSTGQFYIGDYANSVIAVFAADGSQLRQIPWQSSGFTVDADNNLHTIHYDDKVGHFHVKYSANGTELSRVQLGLPEMQNPRIWHVNAKGDYLLSFIPPAGETNSQVLYTYSSAGEILKRVNFSNPYYIKRYLFAGKDSAWLVDADYSKAPASRVKFKQL
ncbi:MAG: hypothetical protein CVV42_10305 [Candidatus Riflebacteria bacterium HGW-Riflebacteria-2]|jgi:hypothetical protein|nr:MAG: hypothetical protein CVV42_10305 [Candidatus Riflebacteria bacterium HGW-Riflebacteria-2]